MGSGGRASIQNLRKRLWCQGKVFKGGMGSGGMGGRAPSEGAEQIAEAAPRPRKRAGLLFKVRDKMITREKGNFRKAILDRGMGGRT